MAHQVSSPSSGSSSAQQQVLSSVPLNASQTPLDLNLSQKVSQNHFKGYDETEFSHHQAFEAFKNPQLKSVPKAALDIFGLNANGCIDSSANCLAEHRSRQECVQSHTSPGRPDTNSGAAATTAPNEPLQDASTAVKDGLPVVNEPATISVGRKRKSPRVEAAANAQKELLQSGKTVLEDCLPQANELTPASPGQKRKSPRVIKQQTPDATKKVILALEANEDEGFAKPKGNPRGNTHLSKDTVLGTPRSRSKSSVAKGDAPSDLAERRLLLEERKIRLAEQRFALEEKKLEATIEIGKGLIVSMERMTNTISVLGISSHHR